MYHTISKVIVRREGKGEQETKPCNAKEPWLTKLARGGQEPEAHFTQTGKGQAMPGGWPPTMVHCRK
jgi:hypothetical protein